MTQFVTRLTQEALELAVAGVPRMSARGKVIGKRHIGQPDQKNVAILKNEATTLGGKVKGISAITMAAKVIDNTIGF
ncbi:MAG: hypothetical protein JO126_02235 [Alphaproteobacteria bacterium]|nr:hypothetical protein [Alphaproteobacteria bacterium]MBV8548258.1 hypothetical protein [Alphaproteobacteria bacterium]